MNGNIISLQNVHEGQSGCVKNLLSTGAMRRRLQEIGLIEGTKVKCLQKSPSGDPTAYLIRGAVIALRAEDSSKILVEI
jgi:ferrous iron transport protein A